MLKYLYICLGVVTLTLGSFGIFTPGLPATPFFLLTAFLFGKGSPRLHQKLLDHKIAGNYIKRVNTGLSIKAILVSISIMWCMVCFSAFVVFKGTNMQYIMLGLGVIGTIAQLIVLRKKKAKVNASFAESVKDDKS